MCADVRSATSAGGAEPRPSHGGASPKFIAASCRRLENDIARRGDQDAGTPGFAPDTMIGRASFRPEIVPGIEFPVVDDQLTVEEVKLFPIAVAVGRIVRSRCEPNEERDEVRPGIPREHFAR